MSLRDRFADDLKAAMKAGDTARVSTLRMVLARVKDIDIAGRPRGVERAPDGEVIAALRGMVKSRREAAALYRQGKRPELAAKEEGEIALIEGFLPAHMDEAALDRAVGEAIARTGAASVRDMGGVMADLKAKHGASLDAAKAGPIVKAKLAG